MDAPLKADADTVMWYRTSVLGFCPSFFILRFLPVSVSSGHFLTSLAVISEDFFRELPVRLQRGWAVLSPDQVAKVPDFAAKNV
jgi:hypothetical protein